MKKIVVKKHRRGKSIIRRHGRVLRKARGFPRIKVSSYDDEPNQNDMLADLAIRSRFKSANRQEKREMIRDNLIKPVPLSEMRDKMTLGEPVHNRRIVLKPVTESERRNAKMVDEIDYLRTVANQLKEVDPVRASDSLKKAEALELQMGKKKTKII